MIKQYNIFKSFLRIGISLMIMFSLLNIPVHCLAEGEQGVEDWMNTVYNADNGLPTGEANVVLQTRDGYIWIGSYGGLIRYDGVSFKNFSIEDGTLESSSIRALYEGADGKLYVGTNDMGVYIYQDGTFTRVSYEGEDNAFYSVRSFAETSEGVIYAGTTSGLAKIQAETNTEGDAETETVKLVPIPDTVGNIVYDLACDKNDSLWICSHNGAIIIVRKDAVLTVTDASAWMKDDCYSVLSASDGSIYLGSSGSDLVRLQMKDDSYKTASFTSASVSTTGLHTANDLYEDRDGNIWVLADNGIGFFKIADMGGTGRTAFHIPSVMQELPSISSMIQDYEGNLWTASTKTGVNFFSHGKYTNFNQTANLDKTAVNVVMQHDGYSYVGTDDGLVILNSSYKQVANALTLELREKRVRHIARSEDGTLWFSLYGDGLVEYHPGSGSVELHTTENGLISNQVRMTLPLSDGSLAIAESSGIDIWKDGRVIASYGEEQLPYPFILCMYEAADGTLVAGSDGMGIYTIKGSEIKQYYQEEGLDSGIILRMAPDEEAEGV